MLGKKNLLKITPTVTDSPYYRHQILVPMVSDNLRRELTIPSCLGDDDGDDVCCKIGLHCNVQPYNLQGNGCSL